MGTRTALVASDGCGCHQDAQANTQAKETTMIGQQDCQPNRPYGTRLRLLGTCLVALVLLAATGGCSPGEPAAAQGGLPRAPLAQAVAAETGAGGVAPGVTVTGVGRVNGVPDTLRASVGVAVTRPNVQEALDVANTAADRVLDALREAGVAEEDVQTREFRVEPQYRAETQARPEPVIIGYTVTNLVEAAIRDLDTVGATLDAVTRAGGDDARVQGVTFTLEDNAELLSQARASAVADARAKAEEYAAAAGTSLGALVGLSELNSAQPQAQDFAYEEAAGAARQAPVPPISPGTQEVSVTVTAGWSLE